MKVLTIVHHYRSALCMEKLISGSCWIGPGLDCDFAFSIDLYLCKSIGEVIMQSELGLVWQDLGFRSSVCRPSKFIAVSFMCILWHIKLKKGKSETVLPLFSKFWDLLCIHSCHTEIFNLFFFIPKSTQFWVEFWDSGHCKPVSKCFTLKEADLWILLIGPCLDCVCTFPIALYFYKEIRGVIMQSELCLI